MQRKASGGISAAGNHRYDSHKTLNLMLSIEKSNKNKKSEKIDRSFCLDRTNQLDKISGKLRTKSIIKKPVKNDDDNSRNQKHVRFGASLSKAIVNKNKIEPSRNENDNHRLKKTKSNLFIKTHNIFDFEDSEATTNKKTKDDSKENGLTLEKLEFNRRVKRSKSTYKKGLFDNNNDDESDKESDKEKERNKGRKRTLDYGSRNNQKSNLNRLDSDVSSTNYIKSNKATSTAGKDSGRTKTNQDSYINEKNINGIVGFGIFGVLDGHGVNGHFSSQFVKKYILNRIKNHPLVKNGSKTKEIYQHFTANNFREIAKMFMDADNEIKKQNFNCENSGTTCVLVFQFDEHLICANAGDSRAILIYDEKNDERLRNTKVYPLSFDCKPQNPAEKKRITDKGGVVIQDVDEDGNPEGPFRIYLKGESWPGIAISRSIGDSDAKTIGVIPNPQIIEYTLSPKSKYMIICSDGIWEYISNDKAMNIGNKYYLKNDAYGLCTDLTKTSTNIWNTEDLDGDVDDITVVVVFF